ncbi:MAG TPA: OstA-like protein [Bacteroidia bacterium]|jgi:lipopolysaccharide export system protein LptA
MFNRTKLFLAGILLCFLLCPAFSFAQKKKTTIQSSANSIESDPRVKDARRLIGNVHFTHEGVNMYCDSAYLFGGNTRLEAFSNVRIMQGDTLTLYGDHLKYDGNTRTAEVTKNVRLNNRDMSLTTDFLTYDMNSSIASYHNKGTLVSKENTLVSEHGYYNSKSREFSFKKNVVLTNPEYVMHCDTLRYNTFTKTAYFLGPTTIVSSNQANTIYCENGWYDTDKDISQFNKNAVIVTRQQKLKGDSLYYNRKKGYGKAMMNIQVIDSVENMVITGNFAEYFEKTENSIVTGKAMLMQIFDEDTLFLHGDTLRATYETKDSAKMKVIDYKKRMMFAYHHVKFYKPDIQGKCDSLVYTASDSTMRLFKDPVMWSDKNQLTGDKVELLTAGGHIEQIKLLNNAFVVSQEDSVRFNQVKGKNLTGYFVKDELHKIKVEGNGQTIYYAKDKNKYMGVNKADCTDILILLKDNEVDKITFITKPDATLFPFKDAEPKEMRLKGLKPRFTERPQKQADIF